MSDNAQSRRLIGDWLPINEVSVEAVRERAGAVPNPAPHQLHVWWARRPLAICRGAIAGALLSADADKDRFYALMGTHSGVAEEQRRIIQASAGNVRDSAGYSMRRAFTHNLTDAERGWFGGNSAAAGAVVLDVTAGGGSIPFEAGRLGVRSVANELNPVAGLILRATCRWPQLFGGALRAEYAGVSRRFLERVRALVRDNRVYPPEPGTDPVTGAVMADGDSPAGMGAGAADGGLPAGAGLGADPDPDSVMLNEILPAGTVRLHKYVWAYLWSRTVPCPDCGGEIPLSPNWRLDGAGQGVRLLPDAGRGVCDFALVDTAAEQSGGTVARGRAVCPYPDCGATTASGYIAAQAQAGRLGRRMYCVVVKNQWEKSDGKGNWVNIRRPNNQKHIPNREFRLARPKDDNSAHIEGLLFANKPRWDADNILPNELVPGVGDKVVTLHHYGMSPWRNMFDLRQQLVHGYCVQAFRDLVDADRDSGELTDLRRAAWCYVALAFDKMINRNSLICMWDPGTNKVAQTFATHDFGMKWSYAEMAIAYPPGMGLEWALGDMAECITELVKMAGYAEIEKGDNARMIAAAPESIALPTDVIIGDARMLDLDDDSVDAIVFDPPYHNNVNYAELSDFFYVWLKRTAGYVLGDGLFAEHLTDKVNEAIASPARFRGRAGGGGRAAARWATEDYQSRMDEIFRECHRVLRKDDGIMVVMFTHKSNDAWNAMTIGLIEAGFNITRTWPVKTEAEASLHIRDRAAARSTILLVCRPAGVRRPKAWHEVAQEVAAAVREDVARLRGYGLSPVDLYLASFGPALQVVSENWGTRRSAANPDLERTMDPFGVTPMDALEVARREVIAFRTREIAGGREGSLSDPVTWFYILAQDGAGGATMPFDEANLFARALGVDLGSDAARGILAAEGGRVTFKSAMERWAARDISNERPAVTPLDQAHTAIALAGRQNAAAARQWLGFNGHRWQDGEFRTTFEALGRVRKAGHPDEAAAAALGELLYGGGGEGAGIQGALLGE